MFVSHKNKDLFDFWYVAIKSTRPVEWFDAMLKVYDILVLDADALTNAKDEVLPVSVFILVVNSEAEAHDLRLALSTIFSSDDPFDCYGEGYTVEMCVEQVRSQENHLVCYSQTLEEKAEIERQQQEREEANSRLVRLRNPAMFPDDDNDETGPRGGFHVNRRILSFLRCAQPRLNYFLDELLRHATTPKHLAYDGFGLFLPLTEMRRWLVYVLRENMMHVVKTWDKDVVVDITQYLSFLTEQRERELATFNLDLYGVKGQYRDFLVKQQATKWWGELYQFSSHSLPPSPPQDWLDDQLVHAHITKRKRETKAVIKYTYTACVCAKKDYDPYSTALCRYLYHYLADHSGSFRGAYARSMTTFVWVMTTLDALPKDVVGQIVRLVLRWE